MSVVDRVAFTAGRKGHDRPRRKRTPAGRHIVYAVVHEKWRARPTAFHPGTCDRVLRAVRGSSDYMPHQGERECARRVLRRIGTWDSKRAELDILESWDSEIAAK